MPILIVLTALASAAVLGFLATSTSPQVLFTLSAALIISLFAFTSPKLSLVLLLISMLFSPEIPIGSFSARPIIVRIEDVLIPILAEKTQQKIAELVRESHVARKKAKELLEKAKRRVEELIEGSMG